MSRKVAIGSQVYCLSGEDDVPSFKRQVVAGTIFGTEPDASLGMNLRLSYLKGPGIRVRRFMGWCRTSGYNDYMGAVTSQWHTPGSIDRDLLVEYLNKKHKLNGTSDYVSIGEEDVVIGTLYGAALSYCQQAYPNRELKASTSTLIIRGSETRTGTDHDSEGRPYTYKYTHYYEKFCTFVKVDYGPGKDDFLLFFDPKSFYILVDKQGGWDPATGKPYKGEANGDLSHDWSDFENINYDDWFRKTNTDRIWCFTDRSYSTYYDNEGRPYGGGWDNDYVRRDIPRTVADWEKCGWLVRLQGYGQDDDPNWTGSLNPYRAVVAKSKEFFLSHVKRADNLTVGNRFLYVVYTITHGETQEKNQYELWYDLNAHTNPELEKLVSPSEVKEATYAPYIPIRLWNSWMSGTAREWCEKAYKKVSGNGPEDFQALQDSIGESPSIGDIDFAYMFLGYPLNTTYKEGRIYIFELFKQMMVYKGDWTTYGSRRQLEATLLSSSSPRGFTPAGLIRMYSNNKNININFDIRWDWQALSWEVKMGKILEKNDCSIHMEYYRPYGSSGSSIFGRSSTHQLLICRNQIMDDRYEELIIANFLYRNIVFEGRYESYDIEDCYQDPDRVTKNCGFLVPLQEQSYRKMSLVRQTEVSTCIAYLIFNYYVVKHIPWYKKFLGWIIGIIVAVIVFIFTWWSGPQWAGAAGAGTAGAVGAASGAVAGVTVQAVVTAILKFIASMVVGYVIGMVVTKILMLILPESIARIIGAIVSVIVSWGMNTGSWADLCKAIMENLPKFCLEIGCAVVQGISTGYQAIIQKRMGVLQQRQQAFSVLVGNAQDDLEKRKNELGLFQDLVYISAAYTNFIPPLYRAEPPESFYDRTLNLIYNDKIYDITITSYFNMDNQLELK